VRDELALFLLLISAMAVLHFFIVSRLLFTCIETSDYYEEMEVVGFIFAGEGTFNSNVSFLDSSSNQSFWITALKSVHERL
jgi:hypothetical protein